MKIIKQKHQICYLKKETNIFMYLWLLIFNIIIIAIFVEDVYSPFGQWTHNLWMVDDKGGIYTLLF